ncbi:MULTISPECIES: polynucleotide adenylyltransferase PcnB [Myxococcus]|uniref:Poly(A) polymerase I n=1 Tax=Myxococcus llanfairpwllgwyngyllgogerychwyrndrobwllllantysiliogogogochensis TaxID=2590453 RepID=A0A540WWL9_9BACT|nr:MULTISPECIES: polynucleotide adenylyltransferase PcnB [Myxococcus]NTX04189.1 polynucleotide adenylyltransferase PcnB [Myxococcus sp. CA040A]TQF13392.1 polynucleotide adenylyltransferase PcnB [Myxococcus llanfairpwllgwyngyllgogerychwyrndrobwllllantysiliogogogochensis]
MSSNLELTTAPSEQASAPESVAAESALPEVSSHSAVSADEAPEPRSQMSPLEDDADDESDDDDEVDALDGVFDETGLAAAEVLAAAEAQDAAEAAEDEVEQVPTVLEPEPEPTPYERALHAPHVRSTGEPAEIDPDELDPDALKVVLRLHQHGHQAYLVGGCVRDLLLGKKPKDFDVATSAHPGEVRAIFRNCRLIGRRFRLAHVYFKGGKIIEVSTFRANPTELEAAAPSAPEDEGEAGGDDLLITHDNVFGTAQQDARRRDFTINGLFYDVSEGRVIDYVRGRRDLDERFIRTIGDPEVRMREDPVRILRAVRFAAKLDLDIESRTYAAMEGAVEDLPRCAPARLLEETFRLIRGGVSAPALKLLDALDAMKFLLPPVNAYLKQHGKEGEKTFYAFAQALDRRVAAGEPLDDAILLAALLVPISHSGPPAEPQEGGRPSVSQVVEELLAGFVQSARLPRRIAERCRMLLLAQRTLSGERRRKSAAFRRHPLFGEALTVFEMTVEATGEHREQLDAWKAGEVPPPRPEASDSEGSEPGGQRKRRRRRRRRRAGGEGSASAGSSSGSGAGEA